MLFSFWETIKKRSRRTAKAQCGIVSASLDVIKEKRSQHPETRQAARQAAVREVEEKMTASESKKKAEKAKTVANTSRGEVNKVSKQGAKSASGGVKTAAGRR